MAFRGTLSPNFDCIAFSGALTPTKALGNNTLAVWFKLDNVTGAHELVEINALGGGNGSFDSAIIMNGASIEYSQRSSANQMNFLGGTTVTANVWHHAALTYDGTTLRGYLDGVANGTSTTALTGTRGNWANMQMGPTLGELQDGVFYDAALTPEEILQLYRNRLPGRRQNLVIHLPTFPGSANFGRDYSGNGYNLANSGTPVDATTAPQVSWAGIDILGYFEADGTGPFFSGTATSTTACTGTLVIKNQFSPNSCLSTTACTGTLKVKKFFTSGPAASTTACTGTLAVRKVFSATSTSPTACTGSLQSRIRYTANSCLSPTACTGSLTLIGVVSFSGTAASPTACTGTLKVKKIATSCVSTSPSSCTGTLKVRANFAAVATSTTACTGTLKVKKIFAGIATSTSACQGLQTGGTVLTPAVPEDPRNRQNRRTFAIGHFHRGGRS